MIKTIFNILFINLIVFQFALSQDSKIITENLDEYELAVFNYYKYLSMKEYEKAYELLTAIKITYYNADSSGTGFHPRGKYEYWLESKKNIESLSILGIENFKRGGHFRNNLAEAGNGAIILGFRTIIVKIDIRLYKENWSIRSGIHRFLVTVVKGTDDKVRILGIGSG